MRFPVSVHKRISRHGRVLSAEIQATYASERMNEQCIGFLRWTFRCCVAAVWVWQAGQWAMAAEPVVLRSIAEIHALSEIDAGRNYQTEIEGVVLLYDCIPLTSHSEVRLSQPLFVGDRSDGIFLNYRGPQLSLRSGQRIRVRGRVGPGGFAPQIEDPEITPLGEGSLPGAASPRFRGAGQRS